MGEYNSNNKNNNNGDDDESVHYMRFSNKDDYDVKLQF